MEVLPIKVFSRENECTKVDIWNCFVGQAGFQRRPVVQARGIIGLNVPKYLLRKALARHVQDKQIDYYELTAEGKDWLRKGLLRHLELHPEDGQNVQNRAYLDSVGTSARRVRRQR